MVCDSLKRGAARLVGVKLASVLVLSAAGCGTAGSGDPGDGTSSSSGGQKGTTSSGSGGGGAGGTSNGGTASSSGDTTGTNGSSGNGASSSGASSGGTGDDDSGATSGDDGGAVVSGEGGTVTHGACLDGITDYENAGPFKYTATASGTVKIWVPTVPAGCKVPIVHLANGTGATCANYGDDLVRLATHGFLAVCYEDTNTGAGTQGITAFTTAMTMYPDLVDNKLGSTGHSQGGQAAFTVLQLAEAKWGDKMIYAGLAMEPASGFGTQPAMAWQTVYGLIKSPMFMFSGTADMLVSEAWVGQAYSAMNPKNEVYWWSATGATHIPTPQVPEEQVSIPWFRWKLLGDNAACKFFKAMPGNAMITPGWTKRMSENEAPCQ
jgi:hypothetical protein